MDNINYCPYIMSTSIRRLGFCCKLSEIHPKKGVISIPEYNTQTTTRAWMNRQSCTVAEDKLWSIVKHNIEATRKLVEKVGTWNESLRMVRLSSDICPLWTEPDWRYFYRQPDVVAYMERHFRSIGDAAKAHNVRLSFHPGQFCVLASDNPQIVENSIEEFEYHATMARFMGYGKSFQDFKINVHIAGRAGPEGIRMAYGRLSPEARNCLSIENEEISHGLDTCLTIGDLVPIVLDIHHHWVHSGEYISADSERVKRVIDSWRGVRPTMHYSVSREDVLVDHAPDRLPARDALMECGYNKQKLRAHSDFYWNEAVNDWALTHWRWADIMCESKAKNLASAKLYEQAMRK
jgi:UV DNA damage repair endonuclease